MSQRTFMLGIVILSCFSAMARQESSELFMIQTRAASKIERNKIGSLGLAIDGLQGETVTLFGSQADAKKLRDIGFTVTTNELPSQEAFPSGDAAFHDYAEAVAEIDALVKKYPAIASKYTMGKSLEGRELVGIRLSSAKDVDSLPTAVLMGCHHAREHLSVEVPLMLAKYLAEKYETDSRVRDILDRTEVYITPMVNPDGAEYDISTGSYKYWRKNRSDNGSGSRGVDLNRNYGPANFFGGPGSSNSPDSDTYHGKEAFSEPETKAVRDFVKSRKRTTVLLTFHTFSELILWPWGHTDDELPNTTDRKVFETMGKKMATWNKYTPQKSSELYLASGDTTDWAYDELKIFAFTFELSPTSLFAGGFYPGAKAIEPTFKANLEPALYLIEKAQNPYAVLND